MNKGTRREIVLAVDNERAGTASSLGEGRPGRGAYPRGPKTNAARRGGGPARKFFESRTDGPGCRSPGVTPLSGANDFPGYLRKLVFCERL